MALILHAQQPRCPLCGRGLREHGIRAKVEHMHSECGADLAYRIRWLLDEAYMNLRPLDEPSRTCIDRATDLLTELVGRPIR